MMKKHLLAGALASTLVVAHAVPAAGGNDRHDGSRDYSFQRHDSIGHGYSHGRKITRSVGYTTPVTQVRGVGTFSRSVWVIHNGERLDRLNTAPKATIIQVDDRYFRRSDPCSYEAGVCVIRAER